MESSPKKLPIGRCLIEAWLLLVAQWRQLAIAYSPLVVAEFGANLIAVKISSESEIVYWSSFAVLLPVWIAADFRFLRAAVLGVEAARWPRSRDWQFFLYYFFVWGAVTLAAVVFVLFPFLALDELIDSEEGLVWFYSILELAGPSL